MLDLSRLAALRRQMEDLGVRHQLLRAEAERHADSLASALAGSRTLLRALCARHDGDRLIA